jgi:hypothetical protein
MSSFQTDPFGHRTYRYEPGEGKDVERCPDKLWSNSELWVEDKGRDVRLFMQVRREGVLVMRCSTGHEDGKIRFEGVSIISDQEIQFD